ncbi:lipopolysaccharide biosynthesis protein [Aureimonas leprariae]|uniref:Lipopolysaccharide biosynthesis protein n=1 Tax=Plantimonas leprariae TaxID=2615207 RepID=A0A7V7PM58_9HYPH|nr:lipopolysaccharide biosynthesis protein [Aureimonas leprariae]KAB0677698.1 lipopolysaccharide biosynthesis protein [Aureimonas leprariae]
MSNVTQRLIKGSVWLSVSRAIVNALTALNTIILAWYLVPADFGLVAIGTTLITIVNSVTELSLNQALIRQENLSEEHFSAAWTIGTLRGLLLGGGFAASAYPVSAYYGDPRLFNVLLALSFSLVLSGIANPRCVMLQRQLIFWQDFVLTVSQKLVGFLVTLFVAAVYHSYWALVLGLLSYQITNVVVSYSILPFLPKITFRHLKDLFSFSIWLTLGQIVNTLNWRFEYLVLGKLVDATALGHYTVGNTFSTLPTREATAPLTATIYPGFASVRHAPERLANAYQRAQALVTFVALPAGIGMAVVADPLVRGVLGEKWVPIIFIVQALASIFALQTLGSLVQPLGMALGRTKLLFMRDTQMLCVRMPIIIAGLYFGGLPGLVYARVLTGLLSTLVNMLLVKRLIAVGLRRQLAANFRALVSVALMAAVVLATSTLFGKLESRPELGLELAFLVLVGAVAYVAANVALWAAAKRPQGPETEIQRILAKLTSKLRRRPPAASPVA